jgi:cysteinyl-tRNA synthetase
MALVLYNTLTGRKEPLVPVQAGRVGLYVCGPTVYDHSHIGHARAAVVFDVLVRHLTRRGYQVTYVRNFTDVDDKIIQRANENGEDCRTLAERHIQSYHDDMDALGNQRPDFEPRATEYIESMVRDIQAMIANGSAYPVDGDVYFDVTRPRQYGRLSGRNLEDMRAGARVEVDERKRSPFDFALWKESKPGEPAWPTPWGVPGRPGWHTECLAMSHDLLGAAFDIHGGGHDLVFPHHENEIAQADALGRPFARLWMHNGFVRVNQEKMSKSLGNFFTIRQVREKFHPEVIRLFLLTKQYRGPVDFSEEALLDNKKGLDKAYRSLREAAEFGPPADPGPETAELWETFQAALDDDLNTAKALGHLFEAVRELNRLLDEARSGKPDKDRIRSWAGFIRAMGAVFGFLEREDWGDVAEAEDGLSAEAVEDLIRQRNEARGSKNWAEADRIRNELKSQGVVLEDTAGKTTWRRVT